MKTWHLKGQPHKVQAEALRRGRGEKGFAYFMEMGLGKTAVILAEFIDLYTKGEVDGLVVVCPNSLKQNWIDEADKWGVGDKLRKAAWPDLPPKGKEPFLHAINIEAFSVGGAKGYGVVEKVCKVYKIMLVLDESVMIKNNSSKRTKNLIALSNMARYTRALSGAPVVQGPHDLWAQLRFIGAITGMNYYQFRNKFCQMGGFKGKQVIGYRKDMQHKLNAMLGHCSFRARKDEWTDLPEKIYSTRKVEMNKKQKEAYDKMEDEFLYQIANIEEGELSETTAEMVITQMMKLMQISSGFVIDDEGEVQVLGATNPKVEAVKEALEATDGKVIVFAFYRQSVRTLLEALDEYKPCFIASSDLHKEMNRPQREEKNKFNGDDAHRVMVCQIQSGMYGHTLLGSEEKRCSTSIFYENWYDLNARLQAEDRNHRHGQDRAVQYIDLVASDLDKKAIQALQNKQSIAKAVVDHVKEKR